MRLISLKWAKLSLIMTMMAIFVTGCSGNRLDDLLNTVPSDADVVFTLNVKKVYESAGMKIERDEMTLPKELNMFKNNRRMKRFLDQMEIGSAFIDMEHLVGFVYDNEFYLTFAISDESKLEQLIKNGDISKEEVQGDYTSYQIEDYHHADIVIKGGQGWVCEDGIGGVKDVLRYASESIMEQTGVCEHLMADRAFNGAYYEGEALHKWFIVSGDFAGPTCEVTAQLLDNDGNIVEVGKYFGDIDTKFLKYAPTDSHYVAAVSIPAEFPWQEVADFLADKCRMSYEEVGIMNTVMAYLKKINGTVSMAYSVDFAGMMNSQINNPEERLLRNISGIIMLQAAEDDAKEILTQLYNLALATEVPIEKDGERYHVTISGYAPDDKMDIYLEYIDGALTVSNFIPQAGAYSGSEFGQIAGKQVASMWVTPDSLKSIVKMPIDAESYIILDGNVAKWNVTVNDTDKTFIHALIGAGMDVYQRNRYYKEVMDKLYGYRHRSSYASYGYY